MPRPAFLLALFAGAFLQPPAHAVFVKSEMDRIDHEPSFDSEYFSDLQGFAYPFEWQDVWRSTDAPAYRINGASLDCCDLLLQQDLRFRRRLTDWLAFGFRLEQQEDKERRYLQHRVEFESRIFGGLSAAVFGEPTSRKEDADIGFGLAFENRGFRAELRQNFVDFNFNARGSTTQRYSRKPLTNEFSLALTAGKHACRAAVELDHPLRREVPAENRSFSYRRTRAAAEWRWEHPGGASRRLEYSYEFQRKGDRFTPDPSAASLDSLRHVHRAAVAVEGSWGERDRIEAGAAFLLRAARADDPWQPAAGIAYRRWEAQPYARWRRTLRPWAVTELAGFLSAGENRTRYPGGAAPGKIRRIIEAKLGAGIDFLFGPAGRIGLYGAFDLDEMARPWDGGNIRAMFLF
ncbi:MAG: hypothetical protein HY611_08150 [Elusimicrobia bacterium]|nr:hypothetical protein [Elusimicrobiota bacterium]